MSKNITVSIVMGSQSDWETMKNAYDIMKEFNIDCETKIISAHRTPDRLFEYAKNAQNKGIQVIIAGAGGAAHLPGMIASLTTIPVLGVPVESKTLKGMDSLLSIVQMPAGIPVATLAIGKAGAKNAGLLAVSIIANNDIEVDKKLKIWRQKQTDSIKLEVDKEI